MLNKSYYLRYKDIIIGTISEVSGVLCYTIDDTGVRMAPKNLGYPVGLFPLLKTPGGLIPDKEYVPSHSDIMHWISDRVFPKDREGAYNLLSKLGLPSYNSWEIAKKTNASVLTDNYWMSDNRWDKYLQKHVRFQLRREWVQAKLPHERIKLNPHSHLSNPVLALKWHKKLHKYGLKAKLPVVQVAHAHKELEKSFDELSVAVENMNQQLRMF